MLPVYQWYLLPYFFAGAKVYDYLSGNRRLASSYAIGKDRALSIFPMLKQPGLAGAIVYFDGQHNDSRMNVNLILTAIHYGAKALNHCEVVELLKKDGNVSGALVEDKITGKRFEIKAKGVINATGPFCDGIRMMDDPSATPIVVPSAGVHLMLPRYFSPKGMGLLDPNTSDGRVLFLLPWQGRTIAGTTDSKSDITQTPRPEPQDVEFILGEIRNHLSPEVSIRNDDVLAAFSGLRPLVKDLSQEGTENLSRTHVIEVSESNLITIAGGKWTTYRLMAEETIDRAVDILGLNPVSSSVTSYIKLIGAHHFTSTLAVQLIQNCCVLQDVGEHLAETYGDNAYEVARYFKPNITSNGQLIHPKFPYLEGEVIYACRKEMAVTLSDFIARRTRLAFLDSRAAQQVLPKVAQIMSQELGWSEERKNKEIADCSEFLKTMSLPGVEWHSGELPIEPHVLDESVLDYIPDDIFQKTRKYFNQNQTNEGLLEKKDVIQFFRENNMHLKDIQPHYHFGHFLLLVVKELHQ